VGKNLVYPLWQKTGTIRKVLWFTFRSYQFFTTFWAIFQDYLWMKLKKNIERRYPFLIRYRPGIFLEWLRNKTRKISQKTNFPAETETSIPWMAYRIKTIIQFLLRLFTFPRQFLHIFLVEQALFILLLNHDF